MYIIIRGREQNMRRLKGKTITEFTKNLESEGWPPELIGEEKERIAFEEKQNGRRLRREDVKRMQWETQFDKNKHIAETAKKLGCEKWEKGYPS